MSDRARFLRVGFTWAGVPKTKELEELFSTALDWARYAPNCWVLWTTTDPKTWLKYIKPHLGESDFVFIAELNLAETSENYFGWNKEWFWKWLDKNR